MDPTSPRALGRALGLTLALTVASGCSSELDDPPSTFAVRDSAGIRIVENGPVEDRVAPWRISQEPLFRVGWEEGDPEFESIDYGVIMGPDRFAVADPFADKVYIISDLGAVAEVGRPGGGPGEFGAIVGLVVVAPDTLLVQDLGNQRLHYFVADRLVREQRFQHHTGYSMDGVVIEERRVARVEPGGALLMVSSMMGYAPPPPNGWIDFPVLRVSSDGDEVETLVRLDLWRLYGEGTANVFAPLGAVSVTREAILHARGDRPEVRWLNSAGTVVQIARWAPEWEGVTSEVLDRWEAAYRANTSLGDDRLRERVPQWREAAEGPLPLFGSLFADSDGNVWLGEHAVHRSVMPTEYSVVSEDGRWLGTLGLPPGLHVLAIGADVVLGVELNHFEVPAVVVYRIEKGEG